jgi:hypothetical protein
MELDSLRRPAEGRITARGAHLYGFPSSDSDVVLMSRLAWGTTTGSKGRRGDHGLSKRVDIRRLRPLAPLGILRLGSLHRQLLSPDASRMGHWFSLIDQNLGTIGTKSRKPIVLVARSLQQSYNNVAPNRATTLPDGAIRSST